MADATGVLGAAGQGAALGSAVPGIGTAIGAVAGGLIGLFSSSGDRDKAEKANAEAMAAIRNLNVPIDQAAPIILEAYKRQGILTPEIEQHINVGVSKVSQIQEDPRLKDAQMGALSQMQQVAKGGLRPEDRANLAKIRQQAQQDQQAKLAQIQQGMQARGLAGGGSELAAQLMAAQSGAQGAESAGLDIASQASQRALQAMGQSATMGGQIRAQDFGINQSKASAADELNRFDVQNQLNQQARNVGAKNTAQASNLGALQTADDRNVASQNQEYAAQKQRQQDLFNMQAKKAQMTADAASGQARQSQDEAGRKQQSFGQMGAAAGGILGSVFGKGGGSSSSPSSSDGQNFGGLVKKSDDPNDPYGLNK